MMARIVSTTSALLLTICSACAVAPGDEESPDDAPPAPPAVVVVDDGVDPAAINTGGSPAPTSCPVSCDKWCKWVRGRQICGESCLCVVKPGCTCPTMLSVAP